MDLREVIDISDEDDDGNNGSMYDFAQDYLTNDYSLEDDGEVFDIHRHVGLGLSGTTGPVDGYQSCLRGILELFPDISREYVQQIYDKHTEATGPNERPNSAIASSLIDKILDTTNYPKEKDRIRELKRKREDKSMDEEEAAKWKYMDLRDNPAEYAKVAYVLSEPKYNIS